METNFIVLHFVLRSGCTGKLMDMPWVAVVQSVKR